MLAKLAAIGALLLIAVPAVQAAPFGGETIFTAECPVQPRDPVVEQLVMDLHRGGDVCSTFRPQTLPGGATPEAPPQSERPAFELPLHCAQVYPWSEMCNLPFGPARIVLWYVLG